MLAYWVGILVIVAFTSWYGFYSWGKYKNRNVARLELDARMVGRATENMLNGRALALQLLGSQLRRYKHLHRVNVKQALNDYQSIFTDNIRVCFLGKQGHLIASSSPDEKRDCPRVFPINFRVKNQSKIHRDILLSRPFKDPWFPHRWVFELGKIISFPTHQSSFVMITLINFQSIEGYLKKIPLPSGTAVRLIYKNSYIEGRWPAPNGLQHLLSSPPVTGALLQKLKSHPSLRQGTYQGLVTVDHTTRIGAFYRLNHYPLTAFVSINKTKWFNNWWRNYIEAPLLFLLIALGSSLVAYRLILKETQKWTNERISFERELENKATHDPLTNLPNREGLQSFFQEAITQTNRHHHLLAVGFLDLNDFKEINDDYGHDFGDQFLIRFSKRLQQSLRSTDIISRLGGDEFILIFTHLHNWEELNQVLDRLQQTLQQPITISDQAFTCHFSLGISFYPTDAKDANTLLRYADQAMYVAKKRSKVMGKSHNVIHFHQPTDIPES